MKQVNAKTFIRISEICFTISSFSFLLIPISNFDGSYLQQVIAYFFGVFFWGGLLLGLGSLIILDYKRRKNKFRNFRYPGLFCFFKNKKAKICDAFMITIIFIFIISEKQLGLYHTLNFVLLALMMLSIYYHSIFNGNNYAYAFQKGA